MTMRKRQVSIMFIQGVWLSIMHANITEGESQQFMEKV